MSFPSAPPSPAPMSYAAALNTPSPAAGPPAPPPTPRLRPLPEAVYDGVFLDLPRIDELDELVPRGPMSSGDDDQQVRSNGDGVTVGATRSSEVSSSSLVGRSASRSDSSLQQYINSVTTQETAAQFPSAMRFSVQTGGRATSLPVAGDIYNANGAPTRPQSAIIYPKPRYGVLRPEGVNQVLAYHSFGTYPNSGGSPPIEPDVVYDRNDEQTFLPLPFRGGATTPSTPGNAFAGMSIGGQYPLPASDDNAMGLHLLADTADVN